MKHFADATALAHPAPLGSLNAVPACDIERPVIAAQQERANRRSSFVDWVRWTLFGLVIIVVVGAMTFRRVDIALDPDDGSITAVESRWWGIQKIEHPLRWVPPSSAGDGGWMTKSERGEMYRYIESDNSTE